MTRLCTSILKSVDSNSNQELSACYGSPPLVRHLVLLLLLATTLFSLASVGEQGGMARPLAAGAQVEDGNFRLFIASTGAKPLMPHGAANEPIDRVYNSERLVGISHVDNSHPKQLTACEPAQSCGTCNACHSCHQAALDVKTAQLLVTACIELPPTNLAIAYLSADYALSFKPPIL